VSAGSPVHAPAPSLEAGRPGSGHAPVDRTAPWCAEVARTAAQLRRASQNAAPASTARTAEAAASSPSGVEALGPPAVAGSSPFCAGAEIPPAGAAASAGCSPGFVNASSPHAAAMGPRDRPSSASSQLKVADS